ncbi:hypothetical protein [Dactylococcopsis salina]|uniref:hypothetical protein n=1 Tax=Dactylococcopsis salina TaxID=292566 RepID=UPI0002E501E3|nr:hypothetical protein [Dactylococcopsis salina]
MFHLFAIVLRRNKWAFLRCFHREFVICYLLFVICLLITGHWSLITALAIE